MKTRFLQRIAGPGVSAALATVLGAGLFSVPASVHAADGRYYRMPDGRVEFVRERDLRKWRRDQERRWRDRSRHISPYEGRNSGELGDRPRDFRRFDDREWDRSSGWGRREGGRYHSYPADGG